MSEKKHTSIDYLFEQLEQKASAGLLEKFKNWLEGRDQEYVESFREHPEEVLQNLCELIKRHITVRQERDKLEQDVNNNHIVFSENNQNYNNLVREHNRLVQQYNQLAQQYKQLYPRKNPENHIWLEGENAALKKEKDELNKRVSSLLQELANYRRDKTKTAILGESQTTAIYQEFQNFKDQDIQSTGNQIFQYLSDQDPSLRDNRRAEIAQLFSILSQEILVKESQRLARVHIKDRTDQVRKSVEHLAISKDSRDKIIESINIAISEEFGGDSANNFDATMQVANVICQTWRVELSTTLPFLERLGELIQDGHKLVKRIDSTDPPGELWIEAKDTHFNHEKHEAYGGSNEVGIIQWTVYPGYRHENRIYAKPVVFTSQPKTESVGTGLENIKHDLEMQKTGSEREGTGVSTS
jgi:hypothetical protein